LHIDFHSAWLLRRYKRFLADIRLDSGAVLTIHCPNTGSMKNCVMPESRCWYSQAISKTRKYPQTLEIITTPGGHLAGINTARANQLVAEALAEGGLLELSGYGRVRREQTYGRESSRIDFLLDQHASDPRPCYLEVKSVTLLDQAPGDLRARGYFPDSVSARGANTCAS